MAMFKKIMMVVAVLVIAYFIGPKPEMPKFITYFPVIPANPDSLETYVNNREKLRKIKPDNQSRIVWINDSLKNKTEYAIVYLHGFSASQEEGNPVHRNIAKMFGCNLYLSRLSEHGIDTTDQLLYLTADKYWETAKRALFIGKNLGKKVILMGTSTGATQALQLAAAFPNDVAALILYSPNIKINDPNAWILNNHWGLQIARLVKGSKYIVPKDTSALYKKYWNSPYRLEAAVQLQEMLERTMVPNTFKAITQPTLMLYYYKNEQEQDEVVSVPAMLEMFDMLATPTNLKVKKAMPLTGNHVLASPIKSKDVVGVQAETANFLETICKLPKVVNQ